METYFLQLVKRGELVDDGVGEQFSSQSEARLEAVKRATKIIAERLVHLSARDIINESSIHLDPLDHIWIEIRDATGLVLDTVTFRDILD